MHQGEAVVSREGAATTAPAHPPAAPAIGAGDAVAAAVEIITLIAAAALSTSLSPQLLFIPVAIWVAALATAVTHSQYLVYVVKYSRAAALFNERAKRVELQRKEERTRNAVLASGGLGLAGDGALSAGATAYSTIVPFATPSSSFAVRAHSNNVSGSVSSAVVQEGRSGGSGASSPPIVAPARPDGMASLVSQDLATPANANPLAGAASVSPISMPIQPSAPPPAKVLVSSAQPAAPTAPAADEVSEAIHVETVNRVFRSVQTWAWIHVFVVPVLLLLAAAAAALFTQRWLSASVFFFVPVHLAPLAAFPTMTRRLPRTLAACSVFVAAAAIALLIVGSFFGTWLQQQSAIPSLPATVGSRGTSVAPSALLDAFVALCVIGPALTLACAYASAMLNTVRLSTHQSAAVEEIVQQVAACCDGLDFDAARTALEAGRSLGASEAFVDALKAMVEAMESQESYVPKADVVSARNAMAFATATGTRTPPHWIVDSAPSSSHNSMHDIPRVATTDSDSGNLNSRNNSGVPLRSQITLAGIPMVDGRASSHSSPKSELVRSGADSRVSTAKSEQLRSGNDSRVSTANTSHRGSKSVRANSTPVVTPGVRVVAVLAVSCDELFDILAKGSESPTPGDHHQHHAEIVEHIDNLVKLTTQCSDSSGETILPSSGGVVFVAWGVKTGAADAANFAAQAALAVASRAALQGLTVRCGVSLGPMHCFVSGGGKFKALHTIGAPMARAEALARCARSFGVSNLLDGQTMERVEYTHMLRPVDVIRFRGSKSAIIIGEVVRAFPEVEVEEWMYVVDDNNRERGVGLQAYSRAFDLFRHGKLSSAKSALHDVVAQHAKDATAETDVRHVQRLLTRCDQLLHSGVESTAEPALTRSLSYGPTTIAFSIALEVDSS